MKINLVTTPCLILETVELLYAYVNHIPSQKLTGDGPYCIPGWTLQQIIHDCCSGLADKKSILNYYFGRVSIQDETEKSTCLARNIVYDTLDFSNRTLEESRQALHRSWQVTRAKHLRPYRIGEFGMAYSVPQETEYTPLAAYMEQLPVPTAYQVKLLESFSGYEHAVDELVELIAPVAAKLEQHLQPWAEHAAPLIEQWSQCLRRDDARDFIQKRFRLNVEQVCDTVSICLRFFNSDRHMWCVENNGSLQIYMGVGVPVYPEERDEMDAWEYRAVRLLGSPARVRMFQAMAEKPMTSREIAQQLDMHLGAVSRDVASMFDAKLLTMVPNDGKIRYCANLEAYDIILKHLTALKIN